MTGAKDTTRAPTRNLTHGHTDTFHVSMADAKETANAQTHTHMVCQHTLVNYELIR